MTLSGEIGAALLMNDVDALHDIVLATYFVDLTPVSCLKIIERAHALSSGTARMPRLDHEWSGWIVWLKNRILSQIPFGSDKPDIPRHVTAILHTWFLWLDETDEMIERLRRREPPERDTTARSQITKTQLPLKPINSVAVRVSPYEFVRNIFSHYPTEPR